MAKNDGGPAFPNPYIEADPLEKGMSLRDYIAVRAMAAIIEVDGIQYASNTTAHAIFAYEQADAMLAARWLAARERDTRS